MQNPWPELPSEAPFVLESDAIEIERFNRRARPEHHVHLDLLPEPFVGAPTAPVVLLSLNPGYSPDDRPVHASERYRRLALVNLTHDSAEYPFFLLHPELEAPGRRWWERRLGSLLKACGRAAVAQRVVCVEYFAYHSLRYGHRKLRLPSQAYGFHLVRAAIARQALIVVMRAGPAWCAAIPELADYPRLFRLNSAQNVTVSPGNCPAGFSVLVQAIGGQGG